MRRAVPQLARALLTIVLVVATAPAQQLSRDKAIQDKATFQKVCGACHSFTLIADLKSASEWAETVEYMVNHGAKGTPEEMSAVMRHLARNFTRVNINVADAQEIASALGIDERTARAIVAYRAAHGPFKQPGDLKSAGVPASTIDARRGRIAVR